jgi:hypothetical protein
MLVGGLETREGPPATGTWQGQPRSLRRGGMWRHRTPSRGEGVWAPEAGWSGQACDGLAIIHDSPGLPWGVRVRGGYPRAPLPSWARRGPGPLRARRWSGDHGPSCQTPDRTPRHPEDEGEITDGETLRAWTP